MKDTIYRVLDALLGILIASATAYALFWWIDYLVKEPTI